MLWQLTRRALHTAESNAPRCREGGSLRMSTCLLNSPCPDDHVFAPLGRRSAQAEMDEKARPRDVMIESRPVVGNGDVNYVSQLIFTFVLMRGDGHGSRVRNEKFARVGALKLYCPFLPIHRGMHGHGQLPFVYAFGFRPCGSFIPTSQGVFPRSAVQFDHRKKPVATDCPVDRPDILDRTIGTGLTSAGKRR